MDIKKDVEVRTKPRRKDDESSFLCVRFKGVIDASPAKLIEILSANRRKVLQVKSENMDFIIAGMGRDFCGFTAIAILG